jgi:hypothetical protein
MHSRFWFRTLKEIPHGRLVGGKIILKRILNVYDGMVLVLILIPNVDKWQAFVNTVMNLLLPLFFSTSSSSSLMAVESAAGLHLLNELLLVSSVF